MSWLPLSHFVRECRETAGRLGRLRPTDLRVAAVDVAAQRYGMQKMAELPELVNVAALALSLDPLVVHRLRPEIPDLVDGTDLHSLPDEPPRLLRRAWIVESEHERRRALFGDTASLGGYAVDGVVYLVGLGLEGWARVARWTPHWIGEELAEGIARDASPLVDDAEAHEGWTREAARFAVVLGLLLDADGAPLGVRDESERGKAPPVRSKKTKPPPAWVTRYVSLTSRQTAAAGAGDDASAADLTGKEAALRPVSGHLKRQRHGPGSALVKWIYVQEHQARRWIRPGPRRIVVGP